MANPIRLSLALAALVAAIGLTVASTPASAQELYRPWLDPDAKDIDEESETKSVTWSQAIEPNRQDWNDRVKRASELLRSAHKKSLLEAESLLLDATRLAPDQPAAHWYLGQVYYLMGKFEACARARTTTARLDPDFEVPAILRGPSNLDFGIGICLALSGDHVGALNRYKRTLAHGDDARTASFAIRWRIGESYMALGRLDEAIDALKEGARLGAMDVIVRYALAAAYDRNEQAALAAKTLVEVLRRDSTQSLLSRRDLHIAPPEDVFYYDALAKMQPGGRSPRTVHRNAALAIVKFRRFLAGHGKGPWARRAKHHIRALSREPLSAGGAWQHGGAGLDAKQVYSVIEKAQPSLQRCVGSTPGVVYTVLTTSLIKNKRGARASFGRVQPIAGVRTRHYEEIETDPTQIAKAMECLEREASKLALPKPKGPPGESVTLEFPVVAQ